MPGGDAAPILEATEHDLDAAIVGQDGISLAAWECHDLITIALNAAGFIDEIVRLIERDQRDEVEPERVVLDLKLRCGSTC